MNNPGATMTEKKFKLSDKFIEKYQKVKPPFGFNGLGELVYMRTYSRIKEDGSNEQWWETIRRVVEGTYRMQQKHIDAYRLGWDNAHAQRSAQEMYDRMFNMKFLPPGRGLWSMGTPMVEDKGLTAALLNCAFISTEEMKDNPTEPFTWLMDASMLGVGVGFDVKGEGSFIIKGINTKKPVTKFIISDDREGWVESVGLLLDHVFSGRGPLEFDYSLIRAAGLPIKGFGGVAAGSAPLKELHDRILNNLQKCAGEPISARNIVDVQNMIGACVVAGNIRRSAEIVFGDYEDQDYLDLKNYKVNPDREEYGWTSNNSIFADLGMDYSEAARRTRINGEPGYVWLDNIRGYSRMNNGPDNKDRRAKGTNPCFSGDTLIAVADGRGSVPIKELAEKGDDVAVYSLSPEGKVEIQWARCPRETRTGAKMVRVTLDDGSFLDVTPDHKFIMMDGTDKEAKELVNGDSLPRLTKRVEQIAKNGKDYWRMSCNVLDGRKDKIMEHRLVSEFFHGNKYKSLYDSSKESGWIKGGIVIHHQNYNGLDNNPDNLKVMTFKDHAEMHSKVDRLGEKNGMWGKEHSQETKDKIGKKTSERCSSPDFIEKLKASHSDSERQEASERLSANKKEWDKEYYLDQEAKTDLKTVWIQDKLHAVKECDICGSELILPWRERHRAFCSMDCANSAPVSLFNRTKGVRTAYVSKQKDVFHKQMMAYKDCKDILGREPTMLEWAEECSKKNVSKRIRTGLDHRDWNPYTIHSYAEVKQRAEVYNHRVTSVIELEGEHTVYNLTVDKHHTVGIITSSDDKHMSGIYVHQCVEQSLESKECCTLVETFPDKHDDIEDYKRTLKFAYLYAKTTTLGNTHWPETNRVMLRNRRIGCSMSGIAQFTAHRGLNELKKWCEEGYKSIQEYDQTYSDWLAVPKSIKTTSVKPSGSVSLVAGSTPGIHHPESRFYIRRVRLAIKSPLVNPLKKAGYKIEPCFGQEDSTLVVEIPVDCGNKVRKIGQLSIWEQFMMAAFMQKYWADNQVSCSIYFDPEKEGDQIEHCLNHFQYQLKGISLLPKFKEGAYKQMPYEEIDEETYKKMAAGLKKVNFSHVAGNEANVERFCDGVSCEIQLPPAKDSETTSVTPVAEVKAEEPKK